MNPDIGGHDMGRAGANGESETPRWATGSYADFLGLTVDERLLIELRVAIAGAVREARARSGLTRAALGKRIDARPSQIARAETGTIEVSLDLMCRALFAAGGTLADLERAARGADESDRRFEAMKDRPAPEAAGPAKKSRRKAIGA